MRQSREDNAASKAPQLPKRSQNSPMGPCITYSMINITCNIECERERQGQDGTGMWIDWIRCDQIRLDYIDLDWIRLDWISFDR